MASNAILAVFEDFNESRDEPTPASSGPPAPSQVEIGEMREAAWTEGYLAGRQGYARHDHEQPLTAKLLTSLHDLSASTSEAVDAAALAVADLLISTVLSVTSGEWSSQLAERVRMVADRIKPALTVDPEFVLRDGDGAEQHFADISELSRALENTGSCEDVAVRWHRGEAIISRTALLEDLRDAIVPLSAGRSSEQNARIAT